MPLDTYDALALDQNRPRYFVAVNEGSGHVELPNGYGYDDGDVVGLAVDAYAEIDADNIGADELLTSGGFYVVNGDYFSVTNVITLVDVEEGSTLVKFKAPQDLEILNITVTPITAGTGDITAEVLLGDAPTGADDAAANEVQTLTRTSTGGTITLTFDGEETATIPATAAGFTAAATQAALLALDNLDTGDVVVTGSAGGPLTLTFGGAYENTDVPEVVVDNTLATGGTIVAATSTPGDPAGTPLTVQIATAGIDAGSASFGSGTGTFGDLAAEVDEGETVSVEVTTVADAFDAGVVVVTVVGDLVHT
jgi:hypothetical protein